MQSVERSHCKAARGAAMIDAALLRLVTGAVVLALGVDLAAAIAWLRGRVAMVEKTSETIKNDERPGWHTGRSKSFYDGGPRRWPGSVG